MTEQVEKPVSDVGQEKPKRSRKKAATDEVVAPQSNDANEGVKDTESDAQTQPESTGDSEKGPESAADQQKPTDILNFFKLPVSEQSADTEQTDTAEEVKPVLAANQLRILNKGPASFCRISGKKLPTNTLSLINFASTAQKQRALSNFKQLNNLAGYERYIVEGS